MSRETAGDPIGRRRFLAATVLGGSLDAGAFPGRAARAGDPGGDAPGSATAGRPLQAVAWPTFQRTAGNTGATPDGEGPVADLAGDWSYGTGAGVHAQPVVAGGRVYASSAAINGEAGRLSAVDAASGNEAWTYGVRGGVLASPAVADGRVILATRSGVHAVGAGDGRRRWAVDPPASPFGSPTVAGDTVYVGGADGRVYALAAGDGSERWRADVDEAVPGAPAVGDGVVYAGTEAGSLYALDAATGDRRWRVDAGGPLRTAPALAGDRLYATVLDRGLVAFDAADGADRWTYRIRGETLSAPAVATWAGESGDGSGDGDGGAGDGSGGSGGGGNPGGTVYCTAESAVHAVSLATGGERWRADTDGYTGVFRIAPPPTVLGETVYATTGYRSVYGFDAVTGDERFSVDPGADADVRSLVVAGGRLFLGTAGGRLRAFSGATNLAPRPAFDYAPRTPAPGETVTFDAGATVDPDGEVARYEWDFDGDGGVDATGRRVTHAFEAAGDYRVTLRVVDGAGASATRTLDSPLVVGGAGTTAGAGDGVDALLDRVPGGRTTVLAGGGVVGLFVLASLARRALGGDDSTERPRADPQRSRETAAPDAVGGSDGGHRESEAGRRQRGGDTRRQSGGDTRRQSDGRDPGSATVRTGPESRDPGATREADPGATREADPGATREADPTGRRPDRPTSPSVGHSDAPDRPLADTDLGADADLGVDLGPDPAFDAFETVERVGSGPATAVDRVTHPATRRALARKTLSTGDGTVARDRFGAFVEGVETWSKVDDHAGILPVLAWGERPVPWVVTPYAAGGPLDALFGSLDAEEAAAVAAACCEAVHHGHRHGLVHAHLAPSNVLLVEAGSGPRIADWEVAGLDAGPGQPGVDLAYAAPEQVAPDRFGDAGPPTDVYQLGALAHALVAGAPPHAAGVRDRGAAAVTDGPAPRTILGDLPGRLADPVATALARSPADRHETALHFRDALRRSVRDRG